MNICVEQIQEWFVDGISTLRKTVPNTNGWRSCSVPC